MRVRMMLAAALVTASWVCAQERADAPEAVIIPVRTLSGDSFNRLVKLLGVFNARLTADDKLRTIVVYAPKDVAAQMRKVVEQLDQPGSEAAIGRNIEMTLAFLRCSTGAQAGGGAVPADLEPAVRQLRAATQYKNVELWDVVPLHLQEGKVTDHSFRLPHALPQAPGAAVTAQLRIVPEAVSRRDSGRYVRFERVSISLRIPTLMGAFQQGAGEGAAKALVAQQLTYHDLGLNTAGDFREGQKTVLGKISGIGEDSAVFVVISLKVLD